MYIYIHTIIICYIKHVIIYIVRCCWVLGCGLVRSLRIMTSLANMSRVLRWKMESRSSWGNSSEVVPVFCGAVHPRKNDELQPRPKTEGSRPSIAFTMAADGKPTWWVCDALKPQDASRVFNVLQVLQDVKSVKASSLLKSFE